jgi:hypothetical protein
LRNLETAMASVRWLDLRDLSPPEPLVQVLDAIHALSADEYLHAQLPREPVPLYALLEETGFAWRARSSSPEKPCEIFIWRKSDSLAREAVQKIFDPS